MLLPQRYYFVSVKIISSWGVVTDVSATTATVVVAQDRSLAFLAQYPETTDCVMNRLCVLRTTRIGAASRTARTGACLFQAMRRSSEFRELGSLLLITDDR